MPSVTASSSHTYWLDRSAHSRVVTLIASRISVPPMVGVPVFTRCVCGPSLRTAWPTLSSVSLAITHGPSHSEITSDVNAAITARSVT
ncbi:hypothetical protein D3C72_1751980 [compost metagenome]